MAPHHPAAFDITRKRRLAMATFELTKLLKIQICAGLLMIAGTVVAVMQATAPKPTTPLCEQRYGGGVLFSLARSSGTPLQPEDIQARLGGLDWGITTNTKVVKDDAVPYGYALEIAIKRNSDANQERSGMGFTWLPRQMAIASASCISYSFWIPPDFKFGEGGTLPGLVSDAPNEQSGDDVDETEPAKPAPKPFSVRPQWRQDGRFAIAHSWNNGQNGQLILDGAKVRMKPGQWVRVEQEVVLNAPGQNNGIMRVWIDRQLMLERFDITFRIDENQSFQGVTGDTHYIRTGGWTQPPADTRIRLSPLELRLR
jgi:hypothetical protein